MARNNGHHHKNLTEEEMQNIKCPYCGADTVFVDDSIVYGQSFGMIYLCKNYPECDAHVGVHKGTNVPKGRLANKELREYKKVVHSIVDNFWRDGIMTRREFYAWMAKQMQMPEEEAHVAMFDVEQCQKAIRIFEENKELDIPVSALNNMFKKYFAYSKIHYDLLGEYECEFMFKMKNMLAVVA